MSNVWDLTPLPRENPWPSRPSTNHWESYDMAQPRRLTYRGKEVIYVAGNEPLYVWIQNETEDQEKNKTDHWQNGAYSCAALLTGLAILLLSLVIV